MLNAGTGVLMLGIGGGGMRGLAELLVRRGVTVTGSDQQPPPKAALPIGVTLIGEEQVDTTLKRDTVVIYSDAVAEDHPVRVAAKRLRCQQLTLFEAIGLLASEYPTVIAIAGAHGKSSTTAMLGHILAEAGRDPTVLVGAPVPDFGGAHARHGRGDLFIVEADEYRDHFLTLRPHAAVVTAIDHDHVDYFPTMERLLASYGAFLRNIPASGFAVAREAVLTQWRHLPWPKDTVAVSKPVSLPIAVPGTHMRWNAALAAATANKLGVATDTALATWRGVGRRFESLGRVGRLLVISDYGHHPAEIEATLTAAREHFPRRRLLVIFEAHTVERLRAFFNHFVAVLARADGVMVAPVFVPLGRETTTPAAHELAQRLRQSLEESSVSTIPLPRYQELAGLLHDCAINFDVAIAFTAGVLDGHLRKIVSITHRQT